MENQELMTKLLELIEEYLAQDQKISDKSIAEQIMKILVHQYGL